MSKKAFIAALLSASALLALPNMAMASEVSTQVLELAEQQNFEQALSILARQDEPTRRSYDHRFLKARILSWDGQYKEARRELTVLMSEHPNNVDLELAMGNLEYYQGNLDAAEVNYRSVLSKVPTYNDARTGLESVTRAREATVKKPWRIDSGLSLSGLERTDLSDWNNQFLRVEYSPGALAYHVSAQRYNRFDDTDIQFQVGLSDAVKNGWDWGVELGATPDADFRPEFSLAAHTGRSISIGDDTVIYPGVSYRFDQYDAGGVHTIQPELITYLANGMVLTGRLIGTLQSDESDELGWLLQGSLPVHDRLSMRAGYANAPDTIDGLTLTTQSVFGGLSFKVNEAFELHLDLSRDDREDSYIRNSVNVGFTHKR